jgi:phytoene desaturase
MTKKSVVIIGAGIGGLATGCLLAKAGYEVTILEKNNQPGGRAGILKSEGFTFDTGPSWYLMPDVFEHFFALLNERLEDYLHLVRLQQPAFRIWSKGADKIDITGDLATDKVVFDQIEPGAGAALERYLANARQTYATALHMYTYKNYDGLNGLIGPQLIRALRDIPLFGTLHGHVARSFHDPLLQKILLYPSVFLGASPYAAPALYRLLNHATHTQGVYYPMGGMYRITEALWDIGKRYGVTFRFGASVEKIIVKAGNAAGVVANGQHIAADIVISDAGVQNTETTLLDKQQRDHSAQYWQKRTLAPSALLLYIGTDRAYPSLAHHNLLFSADWRTNFAELASAEHFPADPSLYVCAPSRTDPAVAPKGHENIFVLVPIAAGLQYTTEQLRDYTDTIVRTMAQELRLTDLQKHIVQQHLFCVDDFTSRFNSPQGTALGLAHTLRQTAFLRPRNASKKVAGLYYVGADVHPGIGVPSALISAELVYKRLIRDRSGQALSSLSLQ